MGGGVASFDLTPTLDPCRLEEPPSYKPPTPKAKLEEPEMVRCSSRAPATLLPFPLFLPGVEWEGAVGLGQGCLGRATMRGPDFLLLCHATALPTLHSGGLRAQLSEDALLRCWCLLC